MLKQPLTILLICVFYSASTFAQDTRTYDGTLNNQSHPDWGAANTQMLRLTTIDYSDGVSEPSGLERPNPRSLSNLLFGQNNIIDDPLNMSDFTWVFGQFIDHDITAVPDDLDEPFRISVPKGDIHFDPFGAGTAIVPMFRSAYDKTTGDSPENPRQHINAITAWIDGSNIYGSDAERARWQRTLENGKLKTSAGQLLPFNTVNGEFNAPIDPRAPHMDNANPSVNKLFIAGDARANEQPLLTAFHTLFVREHNRLCDEIIDAHPSWNDEQIFQHARRITIGLLQSITYDEWLPAMGVILPVYTGYNPNINPAIINIFSAAAFRLGHTLVNKDIVRLTNEGDTISQGSISLRDAFFNPLSLLTGGGLDPLFKGMATQTQQNLDCKVIDDLRNFLFGPPGAGGLDLAAININRGRDRGLPDYNTVRLDFGLPKINQFRDITIDQEMINGLAEAYGSVDLIDPWVGMLAEDHMDNALFGKTIMTIMKRQFSAIRDGDRFYYEVDPKLSLQEVKEIKDTKFVDIIRRNTNIDIMQENVFYAMPHDEISIAAIELEEENLEIRVYPNPVEDQFNVAVYAADSGTGELQIVDMLGRMLESRTVDLLPGTNVFSLNSGDQLTHGIYNVILIKGKDIGQFKIAKYR